MAVFIELTTDAFRDQFATTVAGKRNARQQKSPYGRAGAISVRRPLRGIEIKEDTYAILRVIQANGYEIPLVDAGAINGQTAGWSNFLLQSVQEVRMEKHQIVETFGEPYIYFFGESPRFLDVSCILINSLDFNWEAEWWFNYENYLRGTKSVELGARTYMFYDDNIVEGYMLQAQAMKVAQTPLEVQLTYRLFLTNYQNISFVGDTNFPIRSIVNLPSNITLTDSLNGEQIDALAASGGGIAGQQINGQFVSNAAIQRDLPIRGQISDNRDEWTSEVPPTGTDPWADEDFAEVDDLQQAALDELAAHGVEEGGPDVMNELGLGMKRSPGGIGVGFGAGASASASFNASVSSGFDASASASASASFGGGVGAGATTFVGGRPSAFAMTSVRGTLDPSGQVTAVASASAGFGS